MAGLGDIDIEKIKRDYAASNPPNSTPSNNESTGSFLGDIPTALKRGSALTARTGLGLAKAYYDATSDTGIANTPVIDSLRERANAFSADQLSQYSPETERQVKAIEESTGFVGTAKALAQNPRGLFFSGVEQAPGLAVGGIAQSVVKGAGAKMAAGAVSEGLQTAGDIAATGQDQGSLASEYLPRAAQAGLQTAAIGGLSGKLGGDVATDLMVGRASKGGIVKTMATEGIEEGLQSAQEQQQTNILQGKAMNEDLGHATVLGAALGSAMGGGIHGLNKGIVSMFKTVDAPSTDNPQGTTETINPSTGETISNPVIKESVKSYTDAYLNIQNPSDEGYSTTYNNSVNRLRELLKEEDGKVIDPKIKSDAESALFEIETAHESLIREYNKNIAGESDSSQAPTAPTATEEAIAPTATEEAIAPTATEEAIAPTATEEAIAPTATEEAIAPTATEEAIAPTATEEAIATEDETKLITPEVAPEPTKAPRKVNKKIFGEKAPPKPTKAPNRVTPGPTPLPVPSDSVSPPKAGVSTAASGDTVVTNKGITGEDRRTANAAVRAITGPEGRAEFLQPIELRSREWRARATDLGITDETVLEKLFPKEELDTVTGFNLPHDKVPTIQRAAQYIKDSGGKTKAFFVDTDIRNLGGVNNFFNNNPEPANKVYRAMTDIYREELAKVKGASAQVHIRHGGDEFSSVVVGGNKMAINKALATAQKRIEEYVAKEHPGLAVEPHGKHKPASPKKSGTGIYYGVGEIKADTDLEALFQETSAIIDSGKHGYAEEYWAKHGKPTDTKKRAVRSPKKRQEKPVTEAYQEVLPEVIEEDAPPATSLQETIVNELKDKSTAPEVKAVAVEPSIVNDSFDVSKYDTPAKAYTRNKELSGILKKYGSVSEITDPEFANMSEADAVPYIKKMSAALLQRAKELTLSEGGKVKGRVRASESLSEDIIIEADDSGISEITFDIEEIVATNAIDHSANRKAFDSVLSGISSKFIKDKRLTIKYVEDFRAFTFPENIKLDSRVIGSVKGFMKDHLDGSTSIYLNGNNLFTPDDVIGTLAHELVGHFGLREVLGSTGNYETFLSTLLKDSAFRKDILSLSTKWTPYLDSWNRRNDITKLKPSEYSVFNGTKIPNEIGIKLADEYMAELAKEYVANEEFIRREVGFGLKESETRTLKRAARFKVFNKLLAKIKDFLKPIFGNTVNSYTKEDFAKLIAQSIDNTFYNIHPEMISGSSKFGVSVEHIPLTQAEAIKMFDTISEEDINNIDNYDIGTVPGSDISNGINFRDNLIKDAAMFERAMETDVQELSKNIGAKFIDGFNSLVRENSVLTALTTFGNLPSQKAYRGINNIFKGQLAVLEKYPRQFHNIINNLTPLQNQLVFEYFTTKDSKALDNLQITEAQKTVIRNAKESINKVGKSLNELGMISDESYEKNEDAYLHLTYLKYIDQFKGSNKTPYAAWAKKRKDLSLQERLELGMIKDVRFLVPETMGMLYRDHTILSMFSTIADTSIKANTHWVITGSGKVQYNGKKLSYEKALAKLDEIKFILEEHNLRNENTFGDATAPELMVALRREADALARGINEMDNKMSGQIDRAFEKAKEEGSTTATTRDEFLLMHYTRMPNTNKQGALRNKYVRKEIYRDLESINNAFILTDKGATEKFFAEGGGLERIHRAFKTLHVGVNPASHVRNILGNFSLLDLSTSTNKAKLIGMLYSEVSDVISGKQSDFWKLAESFGLFGVTFSAIELQNLHNVYSGELKQAKADYEARKGSTLDSHMSFMDERMQALLKMKVNNAGVQVSKIYGLIEGAFKTVSFKDYIQRWEAENKERYPDGAIALTKNEQQVLYSKAAAHANESIFDYSEVPSMIRILRNTPLGAPFVTFTYKAFGASIRAMVRHPIKFAQYATLPALMTMLSASMNDWDDDDIKEINSRLPDYYRNNSGVGIFPYKDSLGRPQIMDLSFMLPWGQWVSATRSIVDQVKEKGFAETPAASIEAFQKLGALGGPIPQVITAYLNGVNSFTGKPIVTPGANATQQLVERVKFSWDLMVPAWMNSSGWLERMYNIASDQQPKDKFGDLKHTTLQDVANITGLSTSSVQMKGKPNVMVHYETEIQKINKYRASVIRNRNENDKPGKLKEAATRIKLLREQMRKELKD